jgi:hypothetical protein
MSKPGVALVVNVAVTMVLAAGCTAASGGKARVVPGGSGLISLSGGVGAVRLGVSTEAEVTAAIGSPDATAEDSFRFDGAPRYKALGYTCALTKAGNRIPLTYDGAGGPYCRTVYYINLREGVFGSFWTTSAAFRTAAGTRVGTATETAARRERRSPANGCHVGFTENSATLVLVIDIAGFKQRLVHPQRNDHLAIPTAGRVFDFAVDSRKSGVGLLFC